MWCDISLNPRGRCNVQSMPNPNSFWGAARPGSPSMFALRARQRCHLDVAAWWSRNFTRVPCCLARPQCTHESSSHTWDLATTQRPPHFVICPTWTSQNFPVPHSTSQKHTPVQTSSKPDVTVCCWASRSASPRLLFNNFSPPLI